MESARPEWISASRRHCVPRLAAVLLAAGLSGCSDSRTGQDLIARAGGAQRLRDAAHEVRRFAPPKPGAQPETETPVPPQSWPSAFRALAPEAVSVDARGAYVSLSINPVSATGLYVLFEDGPPPQDQGDDLRFQAVAPGIYRYRLLMGG